MCRCCVVVVPVNIKLLSSEHELYILNITHQHTDAIF